MAARTLSTVELLRDDILLVLVGVCIVVECVSSLCRLSDHSMHQQQQWQHGRFCLLMNKVWC